MTLFHDPDDVETSFARSAELAALRPDTTLRVVTGVGHNRILSDSDVVDDVAMVVAGSPVGREPRR
jgi:hypothetical protein